MKEAIAHLDTKLASHEARLDERALKGLQLQLGSVQRALADRVGSLEPRRSPPCAARSARSRPHWPTGRR